MPNDTETLQGLAAYFREKAGGGDNKIGRFFREAFGKENLQSTLQLLQGIVGGIQRDTGDIGYMLKFGRAPQRKPIGQTYTAQPAPQQGNGPEALKAFLDAVSRYKVRQMP